MGMLHCMPRVGAALCGAPLRRLKEHAYGNAVLLGMLHCMHLRPV